MTSHNDDIDTAESDTATVAEAAANRLAFFSDAVVAIAITLLAINLPVPHGTTAAGLADAMGSHARTFLAFGISFVVIASNWSAHHGLFRHLIRSDAGLRRLNFVWLLSIILTPWATDLLAGETNPDATGSGEAFLFSIYAAVLVTSYLSFFAMTVRMRSHDLLRPDTSTDLTRRYLWTFGGLAAAFLISIPVFFATTYAWLIWILVPTAIGFIGRRRRHHPHH